MTLFSCLWIGAFLTPQAADASLPWFKLEPKTAAFWQVQPQGSAWLIHHGLATGKQVQIVYTKPSLAYDIALNTLLERFRWRGPQTRFRLVLQEPDQAFAPGGCDLVIAMGSDAAQYLKVQLLGQTTPVVTLCAKDPVLMGLIESDQSERRNFAYTSLDVPAEVQLGYLRKLLPELNQIGLIYSRENRSAVLTQVVPLVKEAGKQGLAVFEVVVTEQQPVGEQLVTQLGQTTARLMAADPQAARSLYLITGSSVLFDALPKINAYAGRIPVLSITPSLVREGDASAVVAIGVSFESNANLAASYALEVLAGKDPAQLPIGRITPPDISIHFRRAQRIGLKIPFTLFERAMFVYDKRGVLVRAHGHNLQQAAGAH